MIYRQPGNTSSRLSEPVFHSSGLACRDWARNLQRCSPYRPWSTEAALRADVGRFDRDSIRYTFGIPFAIEQLNVNLGGAYVTETQQHAACLPGCHTPVPAELESEHLCVHHFMESVERSCAGMRRETVVGGSSAARQTEIGTYVKATAERLSRVAVVSPPLSDEMKKRVLTTFLTLMNLQESLDRASQRNAPGPISVRPSAAHPLARPAIAHG